MNRGYPNYAEYYDYYRPLSPIDRRNKCPNFPLWQNVARVFEFLVSGKLDELTPMEAYSPDLTSYYYSIEHKELIRNPIDPSDSDSFIWDYKNPLHYKLLKLKLKLVTQSDQMVKMFRSNETTCKKCVKESKNYLIFRNFVIDKVEEYVVSLRMSLDLYFDRFAQHRLKNSFDINTINDLNQFIRLVCPIDPICDPDTHLIDLCANKMHALLDLLVYEDFVYPKTRVDEYPRKSKAYHSDYRLLDTKVARKASPARNEKENAEVVNCDMNLDLSVEEKVKVKKNSISFSSMSSISIESDLEGKKNRKRRKKSHQKKSKKNKPEDKVKLTSSALISEIRKNKDKKTKRAKHCDNSFCVLVDFNLNATELDLLSRIMPAIGHKLTNSDLNDYINECRLKSDTARSYVELINKLYSGVRNDNLLREKFLAKYQNLESQNESILDDFFSKCQLMFKVLNEIQTRLNHELDYMQKLDTCLCQFGSSNRLDLLKEQVYDIQLELVNYCRAKVDSKLDNFDFLSTMNFSYLLDIANRFVEFYQIDSLPLLHS